MRPAGRPGWAPLIVVGFAALLRLVGLGTKSFWLDEAFSVRLAAAPWAAFAAELRTREANMSLYYLLLRPWLLLGHGEATVRLLSALAGIGTVPIVYAIGRRLLGRRAGLFAALVMALDPLHLFASQDARGYALAVLLVSASTLIFVTLVAGDDEAARPAMRPPRGGWRWAAYTLTSALALYAHFYAGFVLLAQWLSLAARPVGRWWRPLAACGLIVAGLASPLAVFLLAGPHGNIDWIGGALRTGLPRLARSVFTPPTLVAAVGYGALYVAIIWTGVRGVRRAGSASDRWARALVLLWVLTPIVIPVVVSVTVKPVLDPRYLVVCIPGVALLSGALIDRVAGTEPRRALMIAIVAVESVGAWSYLLRFHKEDWRDATTFVLYSSRPGDVAVFYAPYVRRPFDYYRERAGPGSPAPVILYPSAAYADFTFGDDNPLSLAAAIDQARTSATRTWLVLSHTGPDTACARSLDAALRPRFEPISARAFPAIEVRLYARVPAAAGGRAATRTAPAAGGLPSVTASCPQR